MQLRLLRKPAWQRGKINAQIIAPIYVEEIWGKALEGESTSGFGFQTVSLTETYVAAVGAFLDRIGTPTLMMSLGCGDFSAGARIAPRADQDMACDVSHDILVRNRERWSFPNFEFRQLDLSTNVFPSARVAFIREMLPHFSNADVSRFVAQQPTIGRPFTTMELFFKTQPN